MQYIHYYDSPMGKLQLIADDTGLTDLLFENENWISESNETNSTSHTINDTVRWLDIFFSGNIPDFTPPLHMTGSQFQMDVWNLLLRIPYGEVTTYGDLAKLISEKQGVSRMSAQAVGGAVGSNPISIIVPCHRVIGSRSNLTGYASGLDNKIFLMKIEGHNMEDFKDPRK